jgi:hypothetical protein
MDPSQRLYGMLATAFCPRFAICPICVEIQEEWHRAKTPALKKLWHDTKQQHYNDVRHATYFILLLVSKT